MIAPAIKIPRGCWHYNWKKWRRLVFVVEQAEKKAATRLVMKPH